jgi:hypothetical protein
MIKLKKLLLETPEANPDDIFGEYIFGGSRLDEPAKSEEDTRFEKEFTKNLKIFFGNRSIYNDKSLTFFLARCIELKNQGKYLDFLQPKNGKAYRFLLNLSHEQLLQIIDLSDEEIHLSEFGKVYSKTTSSLYKHRSIYNKESGLNGITKTHSWTMDPASLINVLKDRSMSLTQKTANAKLKGNYLEYYIKNKIPPPNFFVCLESDIQKNKDNFILNYEKIVEKTGKNIIEFPEEKEVVGFGKIKLDKVYYMKPLFKFDKNISKPDYNQGYYGDFYEMSKDKRTFNSFNIFKTPNEKLSQIIFNDEDVMVNGMELKARYGELTRDSLEIFLNSFK